MRLTPLIATATVLSLAILAGSATAGSGRSGEEILALDLTPAGGDIYFLGCSTGLKDFRMCGLLTLWQQTNNVDGLQVGNYGTGKDYGPDSKLTP